MSLFTKAFKLTIIVLVESQTSSARREATGVLDDSKTVLLTSHFNTPVYFPTRQIAQPLTALNNMCQIVTKCLYSEVTIGCRFGGYVWKMSMNTAIPVKIGEGRFLKRHF